MQVMKKDGGRSVELYLPFKHGRKWVRVIHLRPMTWDHSLKWQNGEYKSSLELLYSLAAHPEDVIRNIRYPDVDRVMGQFLEMLPPDIRDMIAAAQIPQKVAVEVPPPVDEQPEMQEPVPQELVEEPPPPEPLKSQYTRPSREEIKKDMADHPVTDEMLQQSISSRKPVQKNHELGFEIE